MIVSIDPSNISEYAKFLRIRQLPTYRFRGSFAEFPDEYAARIGVNAAQTIETRYTPSPSLFDYQRDIARLAIRRRKFCIFADCGLGKTRMFLEYVRHVCDALPAGECALIVSPIMVVDQTLGEILRFNPDLKVDRVSSGNLGKWLALGPGRVGITNFEAFNEPVARGRLGALIIDESSMLKSHYGAWGASLIQLGRGLKWKLACTGTPAPNDRIEFANHAVLMDAFPTVNSFLARYFINRGQTDNRWEIKPHALSAFYRDMSHWCIFLSNPATYGWKDNAEPLPPINVHIHDVPLTDEQREIAQLKTSDLFVNNLGGISSRARLATIAKGFIGGEGGRRVNTNKTAFIANRLASDRDRSALIWCIYNEEQEIMAEALPDAASIDGQTPLEKRMEYITAFKAGRVRRLISKGKILGFGLNLQKATWQMFSGLQDSYETYYQCVKRSNRYGAKHALDVEIPITEIERPMVENVLRKARRVQQDTEEQERTFKAHTLGFD